MDAFAIAHAHVPQALRLDPVDMTGNTAKNLLRRGEAYLRLQDWNHAIEDLSHRLLASNPEAQRMLQTARDTKAKEAERNKKMWSTAFAKAAVEPDSSSGTPAKGAADGKSVRFITPGAGTPSGAGDGSAAAAEDLDTPDKGDAQARKLFAGATPFPASKKRAAASGGHDAVGDAASEEAGDAAGTMMVEKEADGEQGGSVWPWLLGGAAVALGAGALWYLASRGNKAALRR